MLSFFRKKGVSRTILWFLSIIIILSFVVFGTANRLDNSINSAGKAFGKNVSLREFEKAYRDSRDQAILNYGERFFTMGHNLDLEREAWTRIILEREVKKHNITINTKDVVLAIAQIPFFQHGGKFDQTIYESIVKAPSIFDRKVKEFEDGIRRSLAIKKMLDEVGGNTNITEADLKAEYIKRNEQIKLAYVLLNPSDFAQGITISDDEAKSYFTAHQENFREPAMVNVQYVHILYPVKADDKQKQAVKKIAVDMAHELTPKADFAMIAKKYNQTAGLSGFFSQDQPLLTFAWSPEFVDKIFALKEGDITSPMEAPDGWQIVKIYKKKPSLIPDVATILTNVKEAATNDKAYANAKIKAQGVLTTIKGTIKTKDFKAIAAELNLKVEETTNFSRGEYINAPGLIAEFQQESYLLNDNNKLSNIIETSQGPAIAYLVSKESIDEKKYALDKEDFKNMVSAQRRNENIGKFINKLRMEANIQPTLKDKIVYR